MCLLELGRVFLLVRFRVGLGRGVLGRVGFECVVLRFGVVVKVILLLCLFGYGVVLGVMIVCECMVVGSEC